MTVYSCRCEEGEARRGNLEHRAGTAAIIAYCKRLRRYARNDKERVAGLRRFARNDSIAVVVARGRSPTRQQNEKEFEKEKYG